MNSNLSHSPGTLNWGQYWWFFVQCDLEIGWKTLKNNMAPLLYYVRLCASFQRHGCIWNGVTVQKHSIWVNKANLRDLIAATGLVISNWIQIVNFSARVTVKFDGWPCKTIGHLFYATSSFVHLFVPIGEFKLKLQSGNAQSGSNWMIFRAMRPWNLTDDLAKQ